MLKKKALSARKREGIVDLNYTNVMA